MPVMPVVQKPTAPLSELPKTSEICVIKHLPSEFRSYDVKQIEVRALTLGEMKYLHSDGLTKRNYVDLYKSIILNYDVNKLTWSDFSFIAASIAVFTVESIQWSFPVYCSKCGEVINVVCSADNFVEFETADGLKGYPITVNLQGREVEFGYLTVERYLNLIDKLPKIEKHLHEIYELASMVLNLPTDEAFELIKNLTSYEDAELLGNVVSLLYHDVLPIEKKCEHCKHVDKYKVDVEVSTVSPFRENKGTVSSRISFGKRPKQ